MPSTPPWLAAAEAMFNRSIDSSSQAAQLAQRLNSTRLQIDVEGLISVSAVMHDGRLGLFAGGGPPQGGLPVDAVISGSVRALMSLLRGVRPTAARERAAVSIRGDAEIANLYRQFFIAARPDPEEELSRWIGDAPARTLSRLAGGVGGWLRRTHRVCGENIAEYLQEESRDLVARTEVEEFLEGVDQIRESVDRVEARLQALQQGLPQRPLRDKV
jgi:ubiquinone biosynthesis accessory factor UbiJ